MDDTVIHACSCMTRIHESHCFKFSQVDNKPGMLAATACSLQASYSLTAVHYKQMSGLMQTTFSPFCLLHMDLQYGIRMRQILDFNSLLILSIQSFECLMADTEGFSHSVFLPSGNEIADAFI